MNLRVCRSSCGRYSIDGRRSNDLECKFLITDRVAGLRKVIDSFYRRPRPNFVESTRKANCAAPDEAKAVLNDAIASLGKHLLINRDKNVDSLSFGFKKHERRLRHH